MENTNTIDQLNTNNTSIQHGDQEILLSIEALKVYFELRRFGFGTVGHVHAVDDVSFDLYNSEAIAVVGESGCGKSSLMKTVLGLYHPTEGKILFEKQNIGEMKREALKDYRARVGYIQQDPYSAMAPFMTVDRILQEPMIINGITDARSEWSALPTLSKRSKYFP